MFLSSDRRHDAAIRRQNDGYSFRVPTVADVEWVSQFDAATMLKIGGYRVGVLISTSQLNPVHNARGQAGVSKESVDRQVIRRAKAGLLGRVWLFVRDCASGLRNGI
jgi:hypothetical protein